jgi:hypothetical protein
MSTQSEEWSGLLHRTFVTLNSIPALVPMVGWAFGRPGASIGCPCRESAGLTRLTCTFGVEVNGQLTNRRNFPCVTGLS